MLPVPALVATDGLILALALVVFALFHHVLPRHEASVGLVSSRENAALLQAELPSANAPAVTPPPVDAALAVSLDAAEEAVFFLPEDEGGNGADAAPAGAQDALPGAQAPAADANEAEAPATDADEAEVPDSQGAGEADAEAADDEDEEYDGEPVALEPEGDVAGHAPVILGYFGDSFPDKFTQGDVIMTKTGYQSENVNITLKGFKADGQRFYIADIYLRDISCLVTSFAENTFGRGFREAATTLNRKLGGIIAINGDYYGARSDGIVIRNGVLYRSEDFPKRDVCVLYWNGVMETYDPALFDANAAMREGAYQAWNFGPKLLDENGAAMEHFNSDVDSSNPRTALGYYEPGHYCFVVVDGRQGNYRGMTLRQLSALMQQLGCVRAYNLDGGNTSVMAVGNRVVNHPSGGGRKISDIISIVDK